MKNRILELLGQLNILIAASTRVDEQSNRITIAGGAINADLIQGIKNVLQLSSDLGLPPPNIFISDDPASFSDDDESGFLEEPWRLIFVKTDMAKQLKARENESTFLFVSMVGFQNWLEGLDPFVKSSDYDPDFSKPVTFRIQGLEHGFGGAMLWILPINAESPHIIESNLPENADVCALIHVNTDKAVNIYPNSFSLTWGNFDTPEAKRLRYLCASVLSVCLSQELKYVGDIREIMLKGTKRVVLSLSDSTETPSAAFLGCLVEAVRWVYAEKPETRIKLLMDRLSIDIQQDQTFLQGLERFLNDAIHQAKDSYNFVILDRKDVYYKELREVMKDMKSQADLFASKIRDLVASLTRDILGVMFAIGFAFFGKFDANKLNELLTSSHFTLFLKLLSGYLILSFILQLAIHLTDTKLSESESQKWLSVLRNYTTKSDNDDYFVKPIKKRKHSLWAGLIISGFIYLLFAFVVFNLQCIVHFLLP